MGEWRWYRVHVEEAGLEEYKCPGCNWSAETVYVYAPSYEDAIELVKEGYGLCAGCMAEAVVEAEERLSGDKDEDN
jgi:hypothetical protein